jgi:growth hormone-inducible transmembrane protein
MAALFSRPFAVTAVIRQAPRASSITVRAFHQAPLKQTFARTSTSLTATISKSRHTFQSTFRRAYNRGAYSQGTISPPRAGPELRQRLLYGAGLFGGTIVAINLIFNRETREDGSMPVYERSYLNDTFAHTGLGLGIIAVAARALHTSGWSIRLMSANPWAVVGLGLVGSIGTMWGAMATSPEK